ncbi:MAG: radical SAM protein [Deltaproteobacteria bacterium]
MLLSSRGCSHFCWFCITPGICKGTVRYHSIERTLDEMEHLEKRGIGRFWFADPNFTEDRQRTEQLLEKKIERGITTPFWCQTRSDLMDPPLLEKLRTAGADTIAFGLESGSPGVLAGTNKRIELDRVRENVKAAQALGMETELFTIFGLPNETEEDARQTLEFVRSLGIPIQSNSGSQQMQLYFGSTYAKHPERFHFKPFSGYRPRYLSIGDRYETDAMSKAAIRRVRNRWALANEQMERDVYFKQRLFEVLDFLLANREDLKDDPAFYAYGALASCAIEEYDLLGEFLDGYEKLQNGNAAAMEELVSALNFFQQSDRPAGPGDRIIFDSRSWMDGVAFTGISGKYWDILLGRGLLLQSFEEGFIGARENEEIVFQFTFPDDYEQAELRGREVEVQAVIRKVFRTVRVATLDAVRNLHIRNSYSFSDLDLLRDQNEILYYFALRDAEPTELLRTPSHFLTLIHRLAKLAKRRELDRLAGILTGNRAALSAMADTLAAAGKPSWALEYYDLIDQDGPSTVLKRAQCLLALEKAEQALALLESFPEGKDLEFLGTLLECLKKARPDSPRIPSLEHHVLNLRLESALQPAKISRSGSTSMKPLVHGLSSSRLKKF